MQHAASVVQEMANQSIGAAADAQKRRLMEINTRCKECILAINPEYFKKNAPKELIKALKEGDYLNAYFA